MRYERGARGGGRRSCKIVPGVVVVWVVGTREKQKKRYMWVMLLKPNLF